MIRKVKAGYKVTSKSGRHMGTYKTEKQARKRLQMIECFKMMKK